MPLLIVPPPHVIHDNSANFALIRKDNQDYISRKLRELKTPSKPKQTIEKGNFKETDVFSWNQDYDGILQTWYITPNGLNQTKPYIRISTLTRRSDCIQMGAVWEFTDKTSAQKPTQFRGNTQSLLDIAKRKPRDVSPIRFDTKGSGNAFKSGAIIFDTVIGEALASTLQPINMSAGRITCQWPAKEIDDLKPVVANYPARAHRILTSDLTLSNANEKSWLLLENAKIDFRSGVFGDKSLTVIDLQKPNPFDPTAFISDIKTATEKVSHNMSQDEYTVIRRKGRWVYIDRGRAYGLKIGMHLVGNGAKLHVIQFSKSDEKNADVSVAYIRSESKESPLKAGDKLTIDKTVYPSMGASTAAP